MPSQSPGQACSAVHKIGRWRTDVARFFATKWHLEPCRTSGLHRKKCRPRHFQPDRSLSQCVQDGSCGPRAHARRAENCHNAEPFRLQSQDSHQNACCLEATAGCAAPGRNRECLHERQGAEILATCRMKCAKAPSAAKVLLKPGTAQDMLRMERCNALTKAKQQCKAFRYSPPVTL